MIEDNTLFDELLSRVRRKQDACLAKRDYDLKLIILMGPRTWAQLMACPAMRYVVASTDKPYTFYGYPVYIIASPACGSETSGIKVLEDC